MKRPAVTLWLVVGLIVPGCVEKLSLEGRACGCVDGYRCCAGTTCVPGDQPCPGCQLVCPAGERCYLGACVPCDRNNACGADCLDCREGDSGDHCQNGRCACREDSDCPLPLSCQAGTCLVAQSDGGMTDGGGDAGMPDGGEQDGGDGDGGINPACTNNRACGPACQDCTRGEGNWACLKNHCGCLDAADCLPGQHCQANTCVP